MENFRDLFDVHVYQDIFDLKWYYVIRELVTGIGIESDEYGPFDTEAQAIQFGERHLWLFLSLNRIATEEARS